ncbi:MAG TPA: hypothetical protein VEJ22_00750 [Nitrospirota bacterium]|nr:hypothetical protein [Nitrospirota bacterium]
MSVTLDLDEETLKILESACTKRGSSVSKVAQELISKALQEISEQPDHGADDSRHRDDKENLPKQGITSTSNETA